MHYYQIKKSNPYHLDQWLYRQVVNIIGGYEEAKQRYNDILNASPLPPDGMPRGTGEVNSSVEEKADKIESLGNQIDAVEKTIKELNKKYRITYTGEPFDALKAYRNYEVFCYYRSKQGKEEAPAKITWKRYRSEFAYSVAKKLKLF